ncbi:hypothetical protein XELAEV_18007042mg [Xenopus laevis]|uniref:Secreted protein n=1 Tax=Xenopus laevis TaxID=8355 RepID=A0A974DZY0_XENLA|nr:hypothetical protein XELAEV_18007042mg [Xenopus laevis]
MCHLLRITFTIVLYLLAGAKPFYITEQHHSISKTLVSRFIISWSSCSHLNTSPLLALCQSSGIDPP